MGCREQLLYPCMQDIYVFSISEVRFCKCLCECLFGFVHCVWSITVDKCGGSARKSKNRLCWRESCRCNKDRHTFKWKWAARKWGVGRSKPSAAQPGHAKYATTWFLPEIEHRSHDFAAGSSASRSKSYIAYLIRHCHAGMCGEKGRSCLTLLAKHVSSERGRRETNKGRICGKRAIRKLLQIFMYIGI